MYSTGEMVKSTINYEKSYHAPARGAQARAGARETAMDPAAGRASALCGYKKAFSVSPPATVPSQSIHQKQPLPQWNRAPEGKSLVRRLIHRAEACTKFYSF